MIHPDVLMLRNAFDRLGVDALDQMWAWFNAEVVAGRLGNVRTVVAHLPMNQWGPIVELHLERAIACAHLLGVLREQPACD